MTVTNESGGRLNAFANEPQIDVIAENYRELCRALPMADIYYAVKANPAKEILSTLLALGGKFDTASIREIETCDGRYIGELSIAEIEVATISFLAAP